eukprot:44437-Eustigmatos_ZCMA.PRE.1
MASCSVAAEACRSVNRTVEEEIELVKQLHDHAFQARVGLQKISGYHPKPSALLREILYLERYDLFRERMRINGAFYRGEFKACTRQAEEAIQEIERHTAWIDSVLNSYQTAGDEEERNKLVVMQGRRHLGLDRLPPPTTPDIVHFAPTPEMRTGHPTARLMLLEQ